jgi:ATP-dependent 26S proteasome regulatory subunit
MITLRFGKSSSPNYKKAIWLAEQFSQFTPISPQDTFNVIKIGKSEFHAKYKLLQSLWFTIASWKTAELLLNNNIIEFQQVQKYFFVFECADKYSAALIPSDYCKINKDTKGWSCKFLRAVDRDLPRSAYRLGRMDYWFQFGHFMSPTIWEIDKEQLRDVLRREVESQRVNACPFFNFQNVENIISELPDHIDLATSDSWIIRYQDAVNGQVIEKKPLDIAPRKFPDGTTLEIQFPSPSKPDSKDTAQEKPCSKQRYIPEVRFIDIGGVDDILDRIREIIELPLKKPDLFKHLNIKPHKGVLLFGPPGCGKTLIAKAIANEVNAHFISIKGPELLSKYYGESEQNLRDVFEEARELQPSIIFFDEIDSITQTRSGSETLRFDARFVNQLLALMDGIEDYGNVRVLASTNRPELIDEAFLRPGRFDYKLEVNKPTRQGCYRIFKIHTKNMPISEDFSPESFCTHLEGLSGADIAFIVREGAYNCIRRHIDVSALIQDAYKKEIDFNNLVLTEEDFWTALKKLKQE